MAALSNMGIIYIMTHDSIGLGTYCYVPVLLLTAVFMLCCKRRFVVLLKTALSNASVEVSMEVVFVSCGISFA